METGNLVASLALSDKMEAYTTMINVDYEAALKVAGTISLLIDGEEGPKFMTECQGLIEGGNLPDLISKILSKQDVLFASDMDADTEAIFQDRKSVV